MNYYRRYVGDYLRATARLSLIEHGAYCIMLDYVYADEKPLPLDHDDVCRIIRAVRPEERKAVDKILNLYFRRADDGYHNERADEELGRAIPLIDAAKENGKKGGMARAATNAEYMAGPGTLYAIRVSPDRVKVGISGNFTSRLHQHKKKYGYGITVVKTVQVGHMGNAELELLNAFSRVADCEELGMREEDEKELCDVMDRIAGRIEDRIHPPAASRQPPASLTASRQRASRDPPPAKSAAAAIGNGFFYPEKLTTADRENAAKVLNGNPSAQFMLDELAGVMATTQVKQPIGLLTSFIKRDKAGDMSYSHAARIGTEREAAQLEVELAAAGKSDVLASR